MGREADRSAVAPTLVFDLVIADFAELFAAIASLDLPGRPVIH
jgi:hypothetical protein